jgi:hypothetical protein
VFQDEVVEIEPEDEPQVKRRRHNSKKKTANDSDDSFQYGGKPKKTKLENKLDKKEGKAIEKGQANDVQAPKLPTTEHVNDKKRVLPIKQEVRVI